MLLNWTAPFFLVALAALMAPWAFYFPDIWKIALAISGRLTVLALVLYGGLLRRGTASALTGGNVLARLAAVTLAIGAGVLLVAGYKALPGFVTSKWTISIGGLIGGVSAAGPAILRFVPVLKNPTVRKIVLKVLLYIAGLVIPLGALALIYA
jgi:hypothetical protein